MKKFLIGAVLFILILFSIQPVSAVYVACVNGTSATINVNWTFTGAPGTMALVSNVGTEQNALLDFVIPTGNDGAPGANGTNGANGADGDAATIVVNNTVTLPAGSSAYVANIGSDSAAVLDFAIPQGAKGEVGSAGSAATITINNTVTLPAGSSATVTNIGNATAAVFDVGIPQGLQGEAGEDANADQFYFLNGTRVMTGNMSMGSYNINNLSAPSLDTDAANKAYVDAHTENTSEFLFINGSREMTGNLSMGSHYVKGLSSPVEDTDAATKEYVDLAVAGTAPGTQYGYVTLMAGSAMVPYTNAPTFDQEVTPNGNTYIYGEYIAAPASPQELQWNYNMPKDWNNTEPVTINFLQIEPSSGVTGTVEFEISGGVYENGVTFDSSPAAIGSATTSVSGATAYSFYVSPDTSPAVISNHGDVNSTFLNVWVTRDYATDTLNDAIHLIGLRIKYVKKVL
jgi:hypothetical protein